MLRIDFTIIITLVLLLTVNMFSQTVNYQIQEGSVDTGAIVTTGSFREAEFIEKTPYEANRMNVESFSEPSYIDPNGSPVYESTYFEDTFGARSIDDVGDNAMLLGKVNVALTNNVAPPDPTIAVGPNHVIVLTNNDNGILIFDKEGNLLQSINSGQWWRAVWPSENGDPQIIYDHFDNRWVMLFMQIDDNALTAGNLIAFSDDDDPFGTWTMYRMDTRMHGTTDSDTWGDYPQMGFDDQAIYIMTRCFTFPGYLQYNKIRIISKAELYGANAGPVTYTDIWDITAPGGASHPDVIHPSFNYSTGNVHYFLYANSSGANYYYIYQLTDPIGSPVLTGSVISVSNYGRAPDAQQLGSEIPIYAWGSGVKTAPVFKDGYLYATHSIRNSSNSSYGSVKYLKIDVSTNALIENYELGAVGYYYIYPAIAIDKDNNVMITCSRSGDDEYAGSYFLGRRATDPPGLSNAYTLQPGLAPYVCTFCGTRNRWGDYLGVYTDPANEYEFWMVSEYAASTNTYAISIGNTRLQPYSGAHGFSINKNYDFNRIEVGFDSDTASVYLANYGDADLIISNIPDSAGAFHLISTHSFPITLSYFDSVEVKFQFKPRVLGQLDQLYPIENNSTNFPGFNLKGYGFIVFPADVNEFYAISGANNSGNLLNINPTTGAGTNLGPSLFTDILGLSINPKDQMMYGLRTSAISSEIVRVNGSLGDSYSLQTVNIPSLYSIAFDSSGQLYATTSANRIYSIDISDGSFDSVSTMPVSRVAITFNHINNELWGSIKSVVGAKDRIIKIDLLTGDTTLIGQTGFGLNTNDLAFDKNGNLFGINGANVTANDFFSIDQTTGVGTMIGSIGYPDIKALGYVSDGATSVEDSKEILPKSFTLEQNYPNPFNPATTINFSLPTSADVKLTVYNLLGETVRVLIDNQMSAGNHSVVWNADGNSGRKMSSGIYFYELKASSDNGKNFNQIRKMILIK